MALDQLKQKGKLYIMKEYAVLAVSLAAGFAVTALLGFVLIPVLHKLKFGQVILVDIGPKWHEKKQGTPTMGGWMFIIGTVFSVVISLLVSKGSGISVFSSLDALKQKEFVKLWGGLLLAFMFALIGFTDDYIKVAKKRNLGLTEIQKTVPQILVAIVFLYCNYRVSGSSMYVPFAGNVDLKFFYWIFGVCVIYGAVNAVNFTDGIDGLCSSITLVVGVFFALTSFLSGLKEELLQKKTIVLPGLGRLRATRENHLFFVPDEDLNIYPDGFGLASVSLKTHEETEDEVADAISSLTSIIASPSAPAAEGPSPAVEATAPAVVEQAAPAVQEPSAPAVETTASPAQETPAAQEVVKAEEPVEVKVETTAPETPEAPETQAAPALREVAKVEEPVAEKAEEPVAVAAEEPAEVKVEAPAAPQTRSVGRMLLIVCAVLLALLVVYMLLGRIAPGLIDPLLYTPEELEIIRS